MRTSCFHQLSLPLFSRVSPAPMLARWRWHCARSRRILIVVVACPGWPNSRLEVPSSSPAFGSRRSGDSQRYTGEAIDPCTAWRNITFIVGRGQGVFSGVPSCLDHVARGCTINLCKATQARQVQCVRIGSVVGHGYALGPKQILVDAAKWSFVNQQLKCNAWEHLRRGTSRRVVGRGCDYSNWRLLSSKDSTYFSPFSQVNIVYSQLINTMIRRSHLVWA